MKLDLLHRIFIVLSDMFLHYLFVVCDAVHGILLIAAQSFHVSLQIIDVFIGIRVTLWSFCWFLWLFGVGDGLFD